MEFNAPAQSALRNQLSRLQSTVRADVPVVNVDWFIAVASSPPLYNALLSLPERDIELEERLEVDVIDNILTAPGIRVWRAGFTNSGVSNHNRVVDRHTHHAMGHIGKATTLLAAPAHETCSLTHSHSRTTAVRLYSTCQTVCRLFSG